MRILVVDDSNPHRRMLTAVFGGAGHDVVTAADGEAALRRLNGDHVDAVVSDFLSGAAEQLVLEGRRRGGELLLVEGQGSLIHPAYSGVTLGLYHGSVPHVLVLCHRAGATEIEGSPGHPIPPLRELVELHERVALPRRPSRVAAVAVNTAGLDESAAAEAVAAAAEDAGLPACDPVRDGAEPLLEAVLESSA